METPGEGRVQGRQGLPVAKKVAGERMRLRLDADPGEHHRAGAVGRGGRRADQTQDRVKAARRRSGRGPSQLERRAAGRAGAFADGRLVAPFDAALRPHRIDPLLRGPKRQVARLELQQQRPRDHRQRRRERDHQELIAEPRRAGRLRGRRDLDLRRPPHDGKRRGRIRCADARQGRRQRRHECGAHRQRPLQRGIRRLAEEARSAQADALQVAPGQSSRQQLRAHADLEHAVAPREWHRHRSVARQRRSDRWHDGATLSRQAVGANRHSSNDSDGDQAAHAKDLVGTIDVIGASRPQTEAAMPRSEPRVFVRRNGAADAQLVAVAGRTKK